MDGSLADLLVGRTLVGRYRIQEVIGSGGMSVVFRASDLRLGRPVAVKIVSFPTTSATDRAELRERLRREAASSASIPPHPNVVQVYDHGSDPETGVDFIAMELLRGQDLKELLRDGPPPIPEALRLLESACRGVAAGHRAGIVHRDLKPSNIIIVDDGDARTLKILDFGIAKAIRAAEADDLTRTGHVPHSPAYASPEQMRHGAPLSPASDVYQLGLIGYELLSGERPYAAEEHQRIRAGEEVALPARGRWNEVPEGVRGVVKRALAPHAADRYADASALAAALAGGEDDATAPLGASPVEAAAAPVAGVPVAAGASRAAGAALSGIALPRNALIGFAVLVLLLGIWMVGRPRGAPPAAPGPALAEADTLALGDEFRPLQVKASRSLEGGSSAAEGPAAAKEVGRVVEDLTGAWVDGDLDRHVSHYADRVSFYGRKMSRSEVARSRAESIAAYPRRSISLDRTAITFPEPGHAKVLVDRSWDFGGNGGKWSGSSREELLLEQRAGDWRVTSERDVETYR